jgi:hypothetical protein
MSNDPAAVTDLYSDLQNILLWSYYSRSATQKTAQFAVTFAFAFALAFFY